MLFKIFASAPRFAAAASTAMLFALAAVTAIVPTPAHAATIEVSASDAAKLVQFFSEHMEENDQIHIRGIRCTANILLIYGCQYSYQFPKADWPVTELLPYGATKLKAILNNYVPRVHYTFKNGYGITEHHFEYTVRSIACSKSQRSCTLTADQLL